ncbi:MAG: CHAT domain-containing protein, partial [Verrucomicrobiales bacterium]
MYASLASVLSERKKNDLAQLCQAEVDRMDASNVIDKEPEALLLSNTRQGGNWGDLFKGPAAKRLAGRDLKMMRIVARGEFFRRLKLAAAQFAMLAEEKRSAERSQGMAEGLKTLAEAAEIAEVQFRTKRALDVRRVLGAWLAVPGFGREGRKSEHHLLAAWAAAQQNGDEALEASALNDLGISFSARESNGMGIACFDRAAGIAKRSVDLELLSRILLNRARTTGDRAELERAEAQMSRLPDSHTKAQMLVSVGQLSLKQGRVKASYQNSKAALETARRSEDPLATSHALGFLGKLYHSQGRNDQALALSRRALQLAQDEPLRSRDLAFRWTWQIGRVLKAKGQLQSSLESYHRAGELLAEIRQDTVIGYRQRGPGSSFREEIGPFYVELADFAFAEARRHSSDSAEWESSLRQARESIELFKAALLEDYFHDSSITTYRQAKGLTSDALPRRSVGDVARLSTTPTAVLYFIPMESRTEILVELGGRMYWHTAEIERITLETLTKKMRLALDPMVSSGDTTHMAPSRRLYDVLIRPLENLLEEHGVETLVVVPDGKLRSIPIGVLHDGKRFLIERFSLATVPDLLLMDDSGQQVGSGRPLLAGLSESVQGFAALPGVSAEIADLGNQFQKHSSKSLLNEDFTSRSFAASFRSNFDLVHLASHANFSNDLE